MKNIEREQIIKAINEYQAEHPNPMPCAYDVTTFKDNETVDIIKNTVERIVNQMKKDTEMYIICEMAKAYLAGATPKVKSNDGVVPVRVMLRNGTVFFAYYDKKRKLLFTESVSTMSANTLGWWWEEIET